MLRGSIVVLIISDPLWRNVGRAGTGRSLSAQPALRQRQGWHQAPTQRMAKRYEEHDHGAQAAVKITALQQGTAPTEREEHRLLGNQPRLAGSLVSLSAQY